MRRWNAACVAIHRSHQLYPGRSRALIGAPPVSRFAIFSCKPTKSDINEPVLLKHSDLCGHVHSPKEAVEQGTK